MSAWPARSLGDLFAVARGGSPRPIDEFLTDDPAGVNWIMIGDAAGGSKYISSTKKRIRPEGVARSRMVNRGDLLLTNSMSFGRPYILDTSGCIHDGWLVLSPRTTEIFPDFFYYLLGSQAVYRQFSSLAAGAVVKNLNIDLVRGVRVGLPPVPEQRRIAALLDRADAIRRKRQQAIRLADDLLPSLFVDLFGDPVSNPRRWPTAPLGDGLQSIEAGWSAVGDDRPRKPGEFAVLKISAVTSGFFRPEEAKVVDAPVESKALTTPRRGDVLFSRANTRELVAATCLVDRDHPNLFLPDKLWRLTPQRDRFTGEYLRFLLANQRFRAEICRRATGTSGSMLNVSQYKVLSVRAPVPPLELQVRFGGAVWKAFSLRQSCIHAEAVAGVQAAALAQSLFGQST